MKLRLRTRNPPGHLLTMEVIALGILGKRSLWVALHRISARDARLQDLDYDRLIARAVSQHERVEYRRLLAAEVLLKHAAS